MKNYRNFAPVLNSRRGAGKGSVGRSRGMTKGGAHHQHQERNYGFMKKVPSQECAGATGRKIEGAQQGKCFGICGSDMNPAS